MNIKKQNSAWHLGLATAIAVTMCAATPLAMAKKKHDKEPQQPPTVTAKDIAKWDRKVDLNGLPKLKIEGVAHYAQGHAFDFSNTVKFAGAEFNMTCKLEVDTKGKVCLNAITQNLESDAGMSCAINQSNGRVSDIPGNPKMNLCAKFDMDGFNKKGYPKGKVKFVAEAGALGKYKNVDILKKDFH